MQKGYAFASQNKGVLNFYLTTSADPLGCRLNPSSTTFVHFYDNDPGKEFSTWAQYMIDAAKLARKGIQAAYGGLPRYTYAVGTSNGGYQVRRAVELAPTLFDGGVDWEGTYVDEHAPNVLTDLPPGVLNFPDYFTSGFNPNSTAAKNIRGAGYPPDLTNNTLASPLSSMWARYYSSYWEATMCQWQKRLDPTYDTYVSGLATYNYVQRLSFSDVGDNMADFATTGLIQRPLITVAGTLDALLPIDHHARAYARAVQAGFEAQPGYPESPHAGVSLVRGAERQSHRELQDVLSAARVHPAACTTCVRSACGECRAARRCRPTSAFHAEAQSRRRRRSRDIARTSLSRKNGLAWWEGNATLNAFVNLRHWEGLHRQGRHLDAYSERNHQRLAQDRRDHQRDDGDDDRAPAAKRDEAQQDHRTIDVEEHRAIGLPHALNRWRC